MGEPLRNFTYTAPSDNTRVYNPRIELGQRRSYADRIFKRYRDLEQKYREVNPELYDYLHTPKPRGATISSISRSDLNRSVQASQEREQAQNRGKFLSKNQHLWDWTGPFMNTSSITPRNAESRLHFNENATLSTASGVGLLASPLKTAVAFGLGAIGGHYGSQIGKRLGNEFAGESAGALLLPFLLPGATNSMNRLAINDLSRKGRVNEIGQVIDKRSALANLDKDAVVGKVRDGRDYAGFYDTNRNLIPLFTQSPETPNQVSMHLYPMNNMSDKIKAVRMLKSITEGSSIGEFAREIETPQSYYLRNGTHKGYEFPYIYSPSQGYPYSPASYFELLKKNHSKDFTLRFAPGWIRSKYRPSTLHGEVFNNNSSLLRTDNPVTEVPSALMFNRAMRGTVGQQFPWLYGTAHDTERILMSNMKNRKYQNVVDDLNEVANESMGTSNIEVFRTDGNYIDTLYPFLIRKNGGKLCRK